MTAARTGTRRHRLFLAASLSIPLLALPTLEGGLRLAGFGGGDRLFVEYDEWPDHLHADPDVMRRYMVSGEAPAAKIAPILFRAEKPADGVRIVVQGASTAAGFPFNRWGGLAGMLGDRLEAARPDGRIEVISTAMAAINSHTLLDLVDEIIEIEPDAVLVYAGHNEYLGVLGVASALGSARSPALVRWQAKLGRLRVYQLAGRVIACARGGLAAFGADDRHTLFTQAATGSLVPFGSETYRAGLAQFEANIGGLLERYRGAGIPVYLGTVVANDEMPPLAHGPSPGLDRDRWAALSAAHRRAAAAGDVTAERAAIRAWLAFDRGAADAWYADGMLALREGRRADARAALETARNLDPLRFRAPTALNDVIRRLADQKGAVVVEVEERFRAESPDGVVGDDWLLEHVHPNADGYFLLADAYFEALRRDGVLGDLSTAPDFDAARRDMPLTEFDRALAELDVREMRAAFPFGETPRVVDHGPPRDEIEALARRYRARTADGDSPPRAPPTTTSERSRALDWLQAMQQLFELKQRENDLAGAGRVARLVAHEYPTDAEINRIAGRLLIELGQPARARLYLARSLRAAPDEGATLVLLVRADRALGDESSASVHAALLDRLRAGRPAQVARLKGS